MPLTFIDIERRKNWRIAAFFLLLVLMYFVVTVLLAASLVARPSEATAGFWAGAFLVSLSVAGAHFWGSAGGTVDRILLTLGAQPPDATDGIHRVFRNVMQEMHVVTGARRNIRAAVIPSLSLNALAAADLRGNAVIAITEGLLSRLSRPQIEAVVAHEAHHVLSGDCLETTVAASLFGAYSAAMEKATRATRGRIFASPVVLLAWLLLLLSDLLNLFISREREYRADAASVRMTRNPVALAETLHLLSRSWRGAGFIGEGYEMLCIVNPRAAARDEAEGFVADLLSTHPPLGKRMSVLLRMARVSITELDRRAERREQDRADASAVPGKLFYAIHPRGVWDGPFSASELAALPWLTPLTWIAAGTGIEAERAWREPALEAHFASRLREGAPALSRHACPHCHQPLVVRSYESTEVSQCRFCAGVLVENRKLPRIIARRERPCTERVNSLARAVLGDHAHRAAAQRSAGLRQAVRNGQLPCPQCGSPMYRGLYSAGHLMEIDRCSACDITWFDRDELEMLQCMVENRLVSEPFLPGQGPAGGAN